jgi:copper chaperone NosL
MSRVGLVACLVLWSLFHGVPSFGQTQNDLQKHPECQYCGMDRKHFAHSRMVVHHKHGNSVGVCSIFCAAKDYIKSLDDPPDSMKVADYKNKKLIDSVKAYWVMGGIKSGVMTNRAKWAFERKTEALAFIKSYGGELIDFDEAMKASYEDMYEDMRMLKQMKLEHSRTRISKSSSFGRN